MIDDPLSYQVLMNRSPFELVKRIRDMYKYIKIIDDPLSYQALLNRSCFELVKGYV